jgi:hypothetical protein
MDVLQARFIRFSQWPVVRTIVDSSDGREAVGVAESSDVPARGGQELGAEDNAEAGGCPVGGLVA